MLLEKRSDEDLGTRSVSASLRDVAAEVWALGALNEQLLTHVGRRLYFSRDRVSVKKPFARAIGLDKVVRIFEKSRKNEGGHRALGSP
jgi:hypothetical protein